MPAWTLRLLVATNVASLGLNAAVAYVLLARPRNAVSPEVFKLLRSERSVSERAVHQPYVREYQYVDKATGRLMGTVLNDDSPRLEQFVREARLTAQQEVDLRDRFAKRRDLEMDMARTMVREGTWRHGELIKLQQQFWQAEYRNLLPEQTVDLSPGFMPPPGGG